MVCVYLFHEDIEVINIKNYLKYLGKMIRHEKKK